jgi:putative intracellular protease/amidase
MSELHKMTIDEAGKLLRQGKLSSVELTQAHLERIRAVDGKVKGKHVAGFTNEEEEAVGLTTVVPFLLEEKLKERGGISSKARPFVPYVQIDGKMVTGQNPASSGPAAEALLQLLRAGQPKAMV